MIDRRLAGYLRSHRRAATVTTLALMGVTVSWWGQAIALSFALAAAVRGEGAALAVAGCALVAVMLLRIVAREGQLRLALRLGSEVRADLRRRVLRASLSRRSLHDGDARLGARVHAATDAVEGVDVYVSRYVPHLVQVWVLPAVLVVVLGVASPLIAVCVAVGLVVAVAGPTAWSALTARRGEEHADTYEALAADLLESLRTMGLLRSTGAVGARRRQLEARSDALHRATVRTMRASLGSTAVIDGGIQFGVVAGGLLAATAAAGTSWTALVGPWSSASPYLVLLLASEAFRPVRDLAGQWHAGYLGLSAATQLEKIAEHDDDGEPSGRARANPAEERAAARVTAVVLDDVGFAWAANEPVISHLSDRWPVGGVTGIAGPSGVGKSTLLDLVATLLEPQEGSITVELDGGRRPITLDDVAIVPQHPVMLGGSVTQNVAAGRPDGVDDAVVRACLDAVGAEDLDGERQVGESGRALSGGERQRVAIARAMASGRPVVLLDEPTSALDAARSDAVLESLRALSRERIVVMSAHRPDALALCSHVLTLEGVL